MICIIWAFTSGARQYIEFVITTENKHGGSHCRLHYRLVDADGVIKEERYELQQE